MDSSSFFKNYRSEVTFEADRCAKAALFENEHVLVGLNCLNPGQTMEKHTHQVQCRFYVVLEGNGQAWVGDEQQKAEKGMVIWVPAGQIHRIVNSGAEPMVMLVGIAPAHAH